MRSEDTQYGFNFGAAEVTRIFSDNQKGSVAIEIKSPRANIQIYVTKTGKIKVYGRGFCELKEVE